MLTPAINVAGQPAQPDGLSQKIGALNDLTAQQLREEWRRLYRAQPPRLSRDLLIRTIAYRVQELAYGGLSKATQRRLAALIKELAATGSIVVARDLRLRPGARLVREWRGRTHTVAVTEDGFDYAGKTYSSLTTIAGVITGAHWSGPRFFGLNRSRAAETGSDDRSNISHADEEAAHE
jgi:hypothetical protein